MANKLNVKVGVELESNKIKSDLTSLLKSLESQKIKLSFDSSSTKSLQNTIKDINKSILDLNKSASNIKLNSSLTSNLKQATALVKEQNTALKEQQSTYSKLKALQTEEYAIKKQLISATGEHKNVLEKNLTTVKEQKAELLLMSNTQDKLTLSVKETEKLRDNEAKKIRELEQAQAKYADSMNKVKQSALDNMNTMGLSTAEAEKFKQKIESVKCENLAQVKNEVSAIQKEMESARNKVSDFGATLQNIGDISSQIGDALLGAFALPTAGLAYATKELTDFSYEMSSVQAVSGATTAEMEQLEAMAKQMGLTTMHTSKDSAEALKYMGWKQIA